MAHSTGETSAPTIVDNGIRYFHDRFLSTTSTNRCSPGCWLHTEKQREGGGGPGETHPDSFHHEADVADAHEVGALVDGVDGLDVAGDLRGARRRLRVRTEEGGATATVCQQTNEGELISRNRKVSLPRPDPDDGNYNR